MSTYSQNEQNEQNDTETAVILHLFYEDLWNEIANKLINIEQFDLHISVGSDIDKKTISSIKNQFPNCTFYHFENRGRDIAPFISIFNKIRDRYLYICKIHSKKSTHLTKGTNWRQQCFNQLMGSKDQVKAIQTLFRNHPSIGIIVPEPFLIPCNYYMGNNEEGVSNLFDVLLPEYKKNYNFEYATGSMFWFRSLALSRLEHLEGFSKEFEVEAGQTDGTLAHAIERIFVKIAQTDGFEVTDTSALAFMNLDNDQQLDATDQALHIGWITDLNRKRQVNSLLDVIHREQSQPSIKTTRMIFLLSKRLINFFMNKSR